MMGSTKNHYQLVLVIMYVCICNSVTDRQIQEAVRQGADTFGKVSSELGVATCCGQCEEHAREVIEDACGTQHPIEISLISMA